MGLTVSNILKSAHVPFDLYEKNKPHLDSLDGLVDPQIFQNCPSSSPSPAAHYINMRSMEILNSFFPYPETESTNWQTLDLTKDREYEGVIYNEILDNSDDMENYRYYRYSRRIGDREFYRDEQFGVHVKESIGYYSEEYPRHFNQRGLVKALEKGLLRDTYNFEDSNKEVNFNFQGDGFNLSNQYGLFWGSEIQQVEQINGGKVRIQVENNLNNQTKEQEYDLVIACDGFGSKVRSFTEIQLEGKRNLQTFLNVCFKSHKLSRQL